MAKLLFRLNDVPEKEADAVRAILEQAQFDSYETDSGKWGIAVAAIWLRDESRFQEARDMIEAYQRELAEEVRGEAPTQTFIERCSERPVDLFLVLIAIFAILALTLWPFITAFTD